MIKIEKEQKKTSVEMTGYDTDLKYEIFTFLECLETLLPDWDLHSLKEDVSKIDFDKGVIKNDF